MPIPNQNSPIDSEPLHPKVFQSVNPIVPRKLVFRPSILIAEPSGCSKFFSDTIKQFQTQLNQAGRIPQIPSQFHDIKIRQTDDLQPVDFQIAIVEPRCDQVNMNERPNNSFTTPQDCFQRHPQSLFQTPHSQNPFKSINLQPFCGKSFSLFKKQNPAIRQNQNSQKLITLKLSNGSIQQKKRKNNRKDGNVKTRIGKNKQPMAQKFIKKLSGFHYSKNYKQNRNKTLKKIVKRGLSINLQNFTTIIAKLKLSVNRKFIRPDMKIKKNSKGEQIDPKKYFNQYHDSFATEKQREFIERLYSQVFKAVYVTMWKSDERLKRVQNIRIEGFQDKHCKQVTSQIKQEEESASEQLKEQKQSSKQEENQHINESKSSNKRKAFVECLDEEGKQQLELVFDKQYQILYDIFDWGNQQNQKPQKEILLNRIQNFCKVQD